MQMFGSNISSVLVLTTAGWRSIFIVHDDHMFLAILKQKNCIIKTLDLSENAVRITSVFSCIVDRKTNI